VVNSRPRAPRLWPVHLSAAVGGTGELVPEDSVSSESESEINSELWPEIPINAGWPSSVDLIAGGIWDGLPSEVGGVGSLWP
jgi:hypothetical protein